MLVFMSCAFSFENAKPFLQEISSSGTCEIYAKANTNSNLPSFVSINRSGEDIFAKADIKLLGYLMGQMHDIKGVTVFVQEDLQKVINQFQIRICDITMMESSKHIFGFSPYLKQFVFIKNKKCNIHIVQNENNLVIGTPIIFGSY